MGPEGARIASHRRAILTCMYVAAHFALTEHDCLRILADVGAADLVTVHEEGPDATYLPLDLVRAGATLPDGRAPGPLGSLVGHVARNNPQGLRAPIGPALALAHAGDHYVSPADLPSHAGPDGTGSGTVVPTWDYVTVHAYGDLVLHDDPAWILSTMRALTERHERAWALPGSPTWSVDDAPADFTERMIRGVIGIELRIDRLVGKAKMSQNKAPADVAGEIAALEARGMHELAAYKRDVSLPAAQARADLLADVGRRHRARRG